jgi:hypothetical protein
MSINTSCQEAVSEIRKLHEIILYAPLCFQHFLFVEYHSELLCCMLLFQG